MNRPSRTDEPQKGDGYNQSPNQFSNDLTTNQDLNGISNLRALKRGEALPLESSGQDPPGDGLSDLQEEAGSRPARGKSGAAAGSRAVFDQPAQGGPFGLGANPRSSATLDDGSYGTGGGAGAGADDGSSNSDGHGHDGRGRGRGRVLTAFHRTKNYLITFCKFIGPGFMVAVAYIDPGNYSTDIAAGASYRFRLLFVVLLSNLIAIFLQSLSIKLGTVSGLNLAEACRAFLPRWLNYLLYAMAEAAIIATDIAEVIGTAIALNLLIPQIPLVAGCALSILDVMVILVFYRPGGAMKGLRAFEVFVMCLVLGVVVCFCIQLSLIRDTSVGHVFQGYLPSGALVQAKGLYQACGILGATVMPHSLYLGSGIVQSRLRDYDRKSGLLPPDLQSSAGSALDDSVAGEKAIYIPSLAAIRFSMKYSIAELAISLFTFALFVNSAILIVAGASLYDNPDALDADIFGIHDLLSSSLSSAAGTVFALALLLSGISAGIVCTIAGQMVSEGQLNWHLRPWLRRLVTRSISVTPSIIIAGAVGRHGLDAALNGSQVALSVALPFVSAPLIWFTCRSKYMTVQPGMARFAVQAPATDLERSQLRSFWARLLLRPRDGPEDAPAEDERVNMANSWPVAVLAVLIWLLVAVLNVANLVLLGRGG